MKVGDKVIFVYCNECGTDNYDVCICKHNHDLYLGKEYTISEVYSSGKTVELEGVYDCSVWINELRLANPEINPNFKKYVELELSL